MRAFLPVFLLILSYGLHAQVDIAFKVITFTPGASINGKPVTAGLDVQDSDDQLLIPNGGHVGLITADGHSYKLTQPMAVSQVNEFVRVKLNSAARFFTSLYTHETLVMPLAANNQEAETLEDSVFLYWMPVEYFFSDQDSISKARLSLYRSFAVRFSNMYDDSLAGFRVDRNWIVTTYPDSNLKKQKAVLYQVTCSSPDGASAQRVIIRANEKTRNYFQSRLAQLEGSRDQEYLRCAFFELNGMMHDRNMSLYRIISKKLGASDPILQKYLANQISKNNLELVDLER